MRCSVLAIGLCLPAATAQADSLSRRLVGRCATTVSTFFRGALFAAEVSGRKVLHLRVGATDTGRLSPGVCFLLAADRGQPHAVRKVAVTR